MPDLNSFYIGGKWVSAGQTPSHDLIDPSTEQLRGTVSLAQSAHVEAAVTAANSAFNDWSTRDPEHRIALIMRLHDIYERRLEDMARAISEEMGAPIDMARTRQAPAALRHMKNFLSAMDGFAFTRPLGTGLPDDRILMEPIGVVGMITPWNWPMSQIALKVIPALLTGCTMVLKPSEYAPLSATLFAQMLDDAGVPPGVFNLIYGDGATAGAALVAHPDVQMISFTGSTRAGANVMRGAAESFKRVALELGGKGANLIFADADPEAVQRGAMSVFLNSGQSCNAPTRMLVERSVYDAAIATACQVAESLAVDSAHCEGPHIGPVVNRKQYDQIQSLIETGIAQGARLAAGGPGRPAGHNCGHFVRPTVFADVTPEMTIARKEIFGPVLSIMPFETEAEAVRIANDTPYGLTNYVQSGDSDRRRRLARQLRSGMVEMNGRPRGAGAPFGGVRQSGGAREGGIWGLEEYLVVKSVSGWN